MIELESLEQETPTPGVSLKVMGVGGAGGNAVNSMIAGADLVDVQFCVTNTDAQALNLSAASTKIQIGKKITKGLGAGSNPDVGRQSAEEDLNSVLDFLGNTDILFLTAGLGGGTGSGALPVIAQAAKELGVLSIAVVTKPFLFEGKRRQKHAEEALKNLEGTVDTLIVIPNQRLIDISDPNISMLNAFAMANDILKHAIKGISDIITKAGHINVDLADVKTIMKDTGMAIMGTGRATGQDRARQAALLAINSPLLENANITGAKGVLINITGNEDLELQEINQAASMIYEMVSPEANIILGSVVDPAMGEELCITVIATGLDRQAVIQPVKAATTDSFAPLHSPVYAEASTGSIGANGGQEGLSVQTADISHIATHTKELGSGREIDPVRPDGGAERRVEGDEQSSAIDLDDLDTPTFLRKQAQQQSFDPSTELRAQDKGQEGDTEHQV